MMVYVSGSVSRFNTVPKKIHRLQNIVKLNSLYLVFLEEIRSLSLPEVPVKAQPTHSNRAKYVACIFNELRMSLSFWSIMK